MTKFWATAALLMPLFAATAAAQTTTTSDVPIVVTHGGPPTSTVINPNNPASASSIVDSFGATWSFTTTGQTPCDVYNHSPDCAGDWPLLRNGVANDPGSGGGAFQLKMVPGDPNLYAYYNGTVFTGQTGNMWYMWNGTAWSQYGNAPPMGTLSTTAIPVLQELAQFGWGVPNGMSTYNTQSRMGSLPAAMGGVPSGPLGTYINNSAFYDTHYPNLPQDVGYSTAICNYNGKIDWCGSGYDFNLTSTGVAGNTFFTTTAAPKYSTVVGWHMQSPTNPDGSSMVPIGATVSSIVGSAPPYTINIADLNGKPVAIPESFTSQSVLFAATPDYAGIIAGNYDSLIQSQIQTYLLPMAPYIYLVRLAGEWCCQWEWYSPWGNGNPSSPYVSPEKWAGAHAHLIAMLRTYLINCGAGCNPNIKIDMDGPTRTVEAQYFTYSNSTTVPKSLAQLVDVISTDDYTGMQPGWTEQQAWVNYRSIRGYLATMAQQANKPSAWTEWADTSYAYSGSLPVTGYVMRQYINWFASVQGPANADIVHEDYVNTDLEGPTDLMSNWPGKVAAYSATWPNGFGGTHYDGSFFTPIAMPATNPWNGTGPQPTSFTLSPTSVTLAASGSKAGVTLAQALSVTKANGASAYEGITTSDSNFFAVGPNIQGGECSNPAVGETGLCLFTARPYAAADVGVHTTNVCLAETPSVCVAFTLTVD